MNLFGFHIHVSRTSTDGPAGVSCEPPAQKSLTVSPKSWLRGDDLDRANPALSSAYEQVVWVYRAINALAEQVANVPFVFSAGERGRENLITSGPLLDFYARPHPQINRFQYWELRVIWLMLRGECFRVPVFEGGAAGRAGGRLERVLILDPAQFQHIVEDNELIGWRYTGFGRETPLPSQVFLPEEVWFERLPNPFDFWRGMAPLQVAAMAAKSDYAAGAFMKGLIENNGDAGLIVRTQQALEPRQREQLLAALRDRKRRAGMADRPLLLWNGAEVIKPTLSSTDLQFLENRKFSRAEICAAFGRAGRDRHYHRHSQVRRHGRGAAELHREPGGASVPAARGRGGCGGQEPGPAGRRVVRHGEPPDPAAGPPQPARDREAGLRHGDSLQRTEPGAGPRVQAAAVGRPRLPGRQPAGGGGDGE